MLVDRPEGASVQGNMPGQKVMMGVSAEDMPHIMGLLTDLYSNPTRAVIREYATNAFDAHVEAGVKRPIEVTIPSPLSPFFKVKDYGTGLSVQDIHEIYSQYGRSTKRGTNDQVGMLGLGCKSALTYTNQFTLIGVKDGVRCTVSVSRDEEGAGHMTVVDTSATTDPNGVEVVVPAKALNTFEREAQDFFRFWERGSVLVNGKEPEPITGLRINDDLLVQTTSGYGDCSYIVMGHVAYPVARDRSFGNLRRTIVARVPIGSVNFTPSREALHYTPKTERTLKAVSDAVRDNISAAIEREIEACPTAGAAVHKVRELRSALAIQHLTSRWRGRAIVEEVEEAVTVTDNSTYRLGAASTYPRVNAHTWTSAAWVVGWDKDKFTPTMKKKLLKHCADNSLTGFGRFILTAKRPTSPWIEPVCWIDWKVVEAIKLPKAVRQSNGLPTRLTGSYDIHECGVSREQVTADKLDTSKPLYWTHGNLWESSGIAKVLSDGTLVCLPGNRIEKFKRDFPAAQKAEDVIAGKYKGWLANLTDAEREGIALRDQHAGYYPATAAHHDAYQIKPLMTLDPTRISDPSLVKIVRAAKVNVYKRLTERDTFRAFVPVSKLTTDLDNPIETRYPLFNSGAVRDYPDHLYMYLNTAYAAFYRKES